MPIRITNLRIPIEIGDSALPERISKVLSVPKEAIPEWKLLRKSLDVRDKSRLQFVYSAEVKGLEEESKILERSQYSHDANLESFIEPTFEMPTCGTQGIHERPIIIGSGPAGLVAAYFLALQGYQPLVLERGTPVNERIRDVKTFDDGGAFAAESNYLFGEGGAGTFSDGKLTCRGSGPDVTRVLELFAECKGKPSILYEHRPHLGSNRLPAVVKAIRQRIIAMGGEVRFGCKVEDLVLNTERILGVQTNLGFIPGNVVLLGTGHSARDIYTMLVQREVAMVQKPFQMGLRVEHPQEVINRVQFGPLPHEERLGNADYTLVAKGEADVFTFCMCAGGYIIPSVSQQGYFCTNGMSLSKRDSPYANSGLVVTIPTNAFGSSDLLAGMHIQEQLEKHAYELGGGDYRCPAQRATDLLQGKVTKDLGFVSYPRQVISTDLTQVMHPYVAKAMKAGLPKMDRTWRGRFLKDAVLVGPEARGSSPIRIVRDDQSRESPNIGGLYPIGEGAGYAGGIVSAAVDGLRTAKAIVQKYAPIRR